MSKSKQNPKKTDKEEAVISLIWTDDEVEFRVQNFKSTQECRLGVKSKQVWQHIKTLSL